MKPCQIRILSLGGQGAIGLLVLTLFSPGIFLAPLNLFGFFAISLRDSCFSCSSDDALLGVAFVVNCEWPG